MYKEIFMIKIATDSNSGISQDEAKELGIEVIPMPFVIDGNEYYDGVTINHDQFYDFLANDNNVSTSQPSQYTLQETFDKLLVDSEQVIFIPMSSGLSATCDSASNLSKEYNGRVFVVNNKKISATLKQSVLDAVNMAKEGYTADQIKEYLEADSYNSSIYITLDTLKYLKKGGRLTPAAATLAALLRIKPVLQIQGEKLDTYAKVFNTAVAKSKMIQAIKKDFETRYNDFAEDIVLHIVHSHNIDNALKFKEDVIKAFPNVEVLGPEELSLSVACHIGPGSLAITSARKYVSKK